MCAKSELSCWLISYRYILSKTEHCYCSFRNLPSDTDTRCLILLNNQLDAQFFIYVYFYSLHVSTRQVPIIRRIIVSMRHLVYVTLRRWPSWMQVSLILTCIPDQCPFLQIVLICAFDKCTLIITRHVINIISFFFHTSTVHLDTITSFIYPTECTTRLL